MTCRRDFFVDQAVDFYTLYEKNRILICDTVYVDQRLRSFDIVVMCTPVPSSHSDVNAILLLIYLFRPCAQKRK